MAAQIGFNPLLSFIAIFVIHGTFSYATQDSWLPDPLFSLVVKNIHQAKHGSDSGENLLLSAFCRAVSAKLRDCEILACLQAQ